MSFESVRGRCRFGSMQGIFQSERASLRKKKMEERVAAAADFYLDQGTTTASRDHHKQERLCERIGVRRFENRGAAV